MADEHKRAKGSLDEPAGPKHDGHGHGPHRGMHIKKHPDGTYHVHKFHPDGSETEHGVGGGSEEENLDKVHDMMQEHFAPQEAAGGGGGLGEPQEPGAAPSAAQPEPGGAGGPE